MNDHHKRRALEALIERAAEALNLSEEESKALIAPIAEQFKHAKLINDLGTDPSLIEPVSAQADAVIHRQPTSLL